eukprot:1004149-Rhodomonas_salina.5
MDHGVAAFCVVYAPVVIEVDVCSSRALREYWSVRMCGMTGQSRYPVDPKVKGKTLHFQYNLYQEYDFLISQWTCTSGRRLTRLQERCVCPIFPTQVLHLKTPHSNPKVNPRQPHKGPKDNQC